MVCVHKELTLETKYYVCILYIAKTFMFYLEYFYQLQSD